MLQDKMGVEKIMLIIKYISATKENSLILYNVILEQQKTCLEEKRSHPGNSLAFKKSKNSFERRH